MESHYFQNHDKLLQSSHFPAVILELVQQTSEHTQKVLQGTGLFAEDLRDPTHCISYSRYRRLLSNIQSTDSNFDVALRFGRRLPSIIDGHLLQALINASSIRQLMEMLRDFARLYYPLGYWTLESSNVQHFFVVEDSLGQDKVSTIIAIQMLSSLVALLKHSNIDTRPLTFLLAIPKPEDTAPLHTYLGSQLHFGMPVNGVLLPDQIFRYQLPSGSTSAHNMATHLCHEALRSCEQQHGFIEVLQTQLRRGVIRNMTNLDDYAHYFSISSATFKRRLKQHGTSFQKQLDYARLSIAVSMLVLQASDDSLISNTLGIRDRANFRRDFKRWTGLLPNTVRASMTNSI